ncbi:velvet factor-domain-containing protein [Staphylotrichum tortipilum]|uniref:Velvet factor-domain-containing protein n=1 Tax=Staphylotrichum tortipilum TaxID=2831512 RepID=A0AAN6MD09_9PEZI|nr:velvet factor-domain-containing protein [Staphylotrichum longicolle]
MSTLGQGDFELAVRQQPKYACVAIERKPIDPPPIVQLMVNPRKDPARTFLQNPYLILTARLIRKGDEDQDEQTGPKESDLTGTLVSSLYSLKDTDNSQGGFFVFGDLSVRRVGTYRLAFILYELRLAEKECWLLSRTVSDPFVVYATKTFPGLAESTFLTRSFSDQGVRLRLRKDSRTVSTKKRTISQADQMRATQGMHHHHGGAGGGSGGYLAHDPSALGHHDLTSPNGHHSPHHLRRLSSLHDQAQLDRARSSLGSQGSYYSDSPQLRGGEYTSAGAYGYAPYDDHHHSHHPHHKPKRIRMDTTPDSPHGSAAGYDTPTAADYHHSYTHHHPPRTVPDPLASITGGYPLTTTPPTSAGATSYPSSLPIPSPYPVSSAATPPTLLHASMPRLDTSHLPHSPPTQAAPGSATSAFSPGSVSRRSPTGYATVGGVTGVTGVTGGYPAMYASPPAGGLAYVHPHHAGGQGLGIALPGLEMDGGR